MPHAGCDEACKEIDGPEHVDEDLFAVKLRQAFRNRGEIRMELNSGSRL